MAIDRDQYRKAMLLRIQRAATAGTIDPRALRVRMQADLKAPTFQECVAAANKVWESEKGAESEKVDEDKKEEEENNEKKGEEKINEKKDEELDVDALEQMRRPAQQAPSASRIIEYVNREAQSPASAKAQTEAASNIEVAKPETQVLINANTQLETAIPNVQPTTQVPVASNKGIASTSTFKKKNTVAKDKTIINVRLAWLRAISRVRTQRYGCISKQGHSHVQYLRKLQRDEHVQAYLSASREIQNCQFADSDSHTVIPRLRVKRMYDWILEHCVFINDMQIDGMYLDLDVELQSDRKEQVLTLLKDDMSNITKWPAGVTSEDRWMGYELQKGEAGASQDDYDQFLRRP